MEADTAPAPQPRLVTPYRLAVSLLLSVAVVLLWWGFTSHEETDTANCRAGVVERVFPCESDLDLRQSRIGVKLANGYTGVLILDGVELPEDQLERRVETGEVYFTPGEGTETGPLEPGRHCASALYWGPGRTRDDAVRYDWCFNVA